MQGSVVVDDLASFAVELSVPLGARHAMTVRTVVASVAADIGMNVDEIDDLRLAVSEVFTILVEAARDASGGPTAAARCSLVVEVVEVVADPADGSDVDGGSSTSMTVRLTSTRTTDATWSGSASVSGLGIELDSLARSILESVVDDYDLVSGGVVLRKRHAPSDDHTAFDRSS